MGRVQEFQEFRQDINARIQEMENQHIKRFFNLDSNVYKEGALSSKTKEMLGLVASMVLRCDDCITYHIMQARKVGVTLKELEEVFSVALIVGGSIVIPHLRRAIALLDELEEERGESPSS